MPNPSLPNGPAIREAIQSFCAPSQLANAVEAVWRLSRPGDPEDRCALPTAWGTCNARRGHHFSVSDHEFVEAPEQRENSNRQAQSPDEPRALTVQDEALFPGRRWRVICNIYAPDGKRSDDASMTKYCKTAEEAEEWIASICDETATDEDAPDSNSQIVTLEQIRKVVSMRLMPGLDEGWADAAIKTLNDAIARSKPAVKEPGRFRDDIVYELRTEADELGVYFDSINADCRDAVDLMYLAAEKLETLQNEVLAKLCELHSPVAIYGECGHDHEPDDDGVVQIDEIGYTCAKAYDICSHCCCTSWGDQTHTCAEEHSHDPHIAICKTVELLTKIHVSINGSSETNLHPAEESNAAACTDALALCDDIEILRSENQNFRIRAERHREERNVLHHEIERLRAENEQIRLALGAAAQVQLQALSPQTSEQPKDAPEIGECEYLDGVGACRHIALCSDGSRLLEDWRKRYATEQTTSHAVHDTVEAARTLTTEARNGDA